MSCCEPLFKSRDDRTGLAHCDHHRSERQPEKAAHPILLCLAGDRRGPAGRGLFPGIVVWLCGITGIETPSNLIYLFGILILLLISFYQTALLSKQADRITRLTQVLSIEKFYREQKEADRTDEETTK